MKELIVTFWGRDGIESSNILRGYHEPTVKEAIKPMGVGDTVKIGDTIWQVVHRHWSLANGSWNLENVELNYSDENEPDDNVDEEADKNDDYTAEDLIDHASK